MTKEFTLHKLQQGFIVTSDEIKREEANLIPHYQSFDSKFYKLITQQPQIDFYSLKEEEQKEIGWWDVEKLTSFYYGENRGTVENEDGFRKGFPLGFQKAQELLSDRRFTEEDIKRAYRNGWSNREESKIENPPYLHNDSSWGENGLNKFIQSLSQKSWKVECVEENGKIKILKLL